MNAVGRIQKAMDAYFLLLPRNKNESDGNNRNNSLNAGYRPMVSSQKPPMPRKYAKSAY